MPEGKVTRRRVQLLLLAILGFFLAVPLAPFVTRGLMLLVEPLVALLQLEVIFAMVMYVLIIPRIVGSLWIYFHLSDSWGNELAFMALFLFSPLLGVLIYLFMKDRVKRPPAGLEGSRFERGIVIAPIWELIPPSEGEGTGTGGAPGQGPGSIPAQDGRAPGQPPTPPPSAPPSPQYHYSPHYPYPPPPAQYGWPPPYSQPPQPGLYAEAGPWAPPPGAPTPAYGAPPAYGAQPQPSPWGVPWQQPPMPRYRKVGERPMQKRDYLAWHNVALVFFNTYFLASSILLLVIVPLMGDLDPNATNEDLMDRMTTPEMILLNVVILDGIMIWLTWHQVIRRRVIPFSEMGISREQLTKGPDLPKWVGQGIALGLVLFGVSYAIETWQSSWGFAPEDVVGPEQGVLYGYVLWLISGCVFAPLSEELFFRGYAFYAFRARFNVPIALLVTALGFSVIHANPYGFLPILIAGLGLAAAFHLTRSLVPCITAHALFNGMVLTLAYLGWY
jgi:membrane protease YdiL (CAAX protease family)